MPDITITSKKDIATIEGTSDVGKKWLKDNMVNKFSIIFQIHKEHIPDFLIEMKEAGLDVEDKS